MYPSRRIFLRNGLITLAALGGGAMLEPRFLASAARAAGESGRRKVLVCVFQRGAADGLSMVAPHGDPHYYKLRQEIAVPRPKKGDTGTAIDLDGYFGLHPRLDALAPLYQRGELAVIHACGSPSTSRSHFDMQDYMESGVADNKRVVTGWANRALSQRAPKEQATPFRAVAMSASVPRTLQGDLDAMAIRDLDTFGVRGAPAGGAPGASTMVGEPTMPGGATGFEGLYANAVDQALSGAGKESFDAIALLKKANPTQYKPAKGIDYPKTLLGQSLLQVAQLIKADVGVEIAFVQDEGWDTHANQGGAFGQLGGKLLDFGRALANFRGDLGDRMTDVTVLTMTEFGRTVGQNGNRGTDHGHGTCFFAFGGGVKGGKVYADWPTLAPEKLFENRDLAVTTDFRSVFAEVCVSRLGLDAAKLDQVLPGYKWDAKRKVGFLT